MSEVDYDVLLEYSDELIEYEGVLPLLIRSIIMKQWTNNLNKKGKLKEVYVKSMKNKPKSYDEAVNELVKWCGENPKYNSMIID